MRKTRLTKKQSKRSRKSIKKRATTRKKGGNFYKKFILNRDEVFEIYPGLKKVDIHFTDNDAENITIKIVNSLKDKNNIIEKKTDFNRFMQVQVNAVCNESTCNKDNWVKCDSECYKRSISEVTEEINSTLYMLNVLGNSMINGNCKLILSENYELLTNNWEDDYKYFHPYEKNTEPRLIMAFGPSASGKTFMVENAIKMLRHKYMIGEGFPEVFLSIDGGIQRESSYAYSVIRDAIKNKESGFENLVSTGIMSKSIFSSDKVKQNMKTFLNNNKGFNLYIPETLSSCIRKINCSDKYHFYQKYTSDDNFVALNIWQHKKESECDFRNEYKCKGTNTSGKSREQIEGKKYSDSAYDLSKRNGEYEITKTKGISMDIHNSGGPGNKSIIKLFGVDDFNDFKADVLLRDTGINAKIIHENHDKNINNYKEPV